jgi:hypothetical protein
MAGIRRDAADRTFLSVESHRVAVQLVDPETLLHVAPKCACVFAENPRSIPFANFLEQLRHGKPGSVPISLKLDGRDGEVRVQTILVRDGVARVLPTLVSVARLARGLVLEEAVPIRIAEFGAPTQCGFGVRKLRFQ